MNDPTKHNYYRKLLDLYTRGEIPTAGLADIDVAHDDWCGIYTGGYCNCDPEIRVRPLPAPHPIQPSDN
jgi:hypothetical protein